MLVIAGRFMEVVVDHLREGAQAASRADADRTHRFDGATGLDHHPLFEDYLGALRGSQLDGGGVRFQSDAGADAHRARAGTPEATFDAGALGDYQRAPVATQPPPALQQRP
jgi:hypothetical protein